jgi:outer membrane protein insertion porin family
VGLSYTVPGSEVKYYVASYDFLNFIPFWKRFALSTNLSVAYGGTLGDTTSMPPYRNFYAGGPDSVRGYRESRLGPKDNFGNPYGGNLRTVARVETILPLPEKFASSARLSLFYDIGNVFSTEGVPFQSKPQAVTDPTTGEVGAVTVPLDYKFKYSSLKKSAGISVQWLAPLGLFRFSYAFPMNADKGDALRYEDEIERFQFSIGQAF